MEAHMTSAQRRESLGPNGALDLLEDVDFESTMLALEHSDSASPRRRFSSIARRASTDGLELTLSSLAELFPVSADGEGINFLSEDQVASVTQAVAGSSSGSGVHELKIHRPSTRSSVIKTEFPHLPTIKSAFPVTPALLSPTMDSFLRDSWDDINEMTGKSRRTSSKLLEGLLGHSLLSPTGTSPRRLSVKLPGSTTVSTPRLSLNSLLQSTSHSSAASDTSLTKPILLAGAKARAPKDRAAPKQPRRAKQCIEEGCTRRAQSNNRCKTHGGGARCQMPGCDKSSQGGGLCRAHGGGKKCRVPGCTKGTQRLGLCYLHGGIRRCIYEGCNKKDRGNGFCISHGGGRRCEAPGCERSVRKGNHCQAHQIDGGGDSPFKISRGLGLHVT